MIPIPGGTVYDGLYGFYGIDLKGSGGLGFTGINSVDGKAFVNGHQIK